jgi:hypothetical protein
MKNLTAQLASQYLHSEGARPSKTEFLTFLSWLHSQFRPISGIVDFTEAEVSPAEMVLTYYHTGRLLISTAHNHHPFLLPIENAWFRAIHDWHHLQAMAGYDLAGEILVCHYSQSTAPRDIHWMLWSEVVLQAAAAIHTGSFPKQKLVRV